MIKTVSGSIFFLVIFALRRPGRQLYQYVADLDGQLPRSKQTFREASQPNLPL